MLRAELLRQELDRIVDVLIHAYHPTAIYLFGSLAVGTVTAWSDIDLLIVKQTEAPFYDRLKKVMTLIDPQVGIDLVVCTPDEWEDMCLNRPFVKEEILEKGKCLYPDVLPGPFLKGLPVEADALTALEQAEKLVRTIKQLRN